MEEKVRYALNLLSHDMQSPWVSDQLQATVDEGITERVSEQPKNAKDVAFASPTALRETKKEQSKRESYETTRPYTSEEQLDLLGFALTQVFVALPAVRASASSQLKALAPTIEAVEFLSDQDQAGAPRHRQELSDGQAPPDTKLTSSVQTFMQRVKGT